MSPHLFDQLCKMIRQRGDTIQDILPALPGHTTRQAQAHLFSEVLLTFGVPLKKVRDCRYNDVVKMIDICCDKAHIPDVEQYLACIEPEPQERLATIDDLYDE